MHVAPLMWMSFNPEENRAGKKIEKGGMPWVIFAADDETIKKKRKQVKSNDFVYRKPPVVPIVSCQSPSSGMMACFAQR